MLVPSIWNRNSTTDLFSDFFSPFFSDMKENKRMPAQMRADVKELDDKYQLEIDLPGCAKEDVSASLENGYITVTAKRESAKDEKDEKGKYIRRERFYGQTSRSFYVGDELTEEDIKASFENGILKIDVPKREEKKIEDKKLIDIK